MLQLRIPGGDELRLEHLVLDVNGTLSTRGKAIDGIGPAVAALHGVLQPHVVSADTFGTAQALAVELGAPFRRVASGEEKRDHVRMLGAGGCVAVLGPEGTHTSALAAADLVTRSIVGALLLLADPRALVATLRR